MRPLLKEKATEETLGSIAEKESDHSEEEMSKECELQGSFPTTTGLKDQTQWTLMIDPLSSLWPQKRAYEFNDEAEATSLACRKTQASKGPEQPVKPIEDVVKDEESAGVQRG